MNNRAIIVASCWLLAAFLTGCQATAPVPDDKTPPASFVPCVSRDTRGVADASGASAPPLSAASGTRAAGVGGAPVTRTVRETVLVPDASEAAEKTITISPDNRRVAFVTQDGTRVVVDGQPLGPYGRVYGVLCFSPDSQRLAYFAAVGGGKVAAVEDGIAGKPYDRIGENGPIFSPDSQRIAYGALAQGKWFVVIDGAEQDQYDGFGQTALTFSPDSQRLLYAVTVGKQWAVVVDGARGKLYDSIWPPVFSPDSRHVAYAAAGERGGVVVIDGREHGPYEGFLPDSLTFSPDSQRVAYVVQVPPPSGWSFSVGDPNKWVAVVDGTAGPRYDAVMPPIFSPDGQHVAYGAVRLKARIGIPPIYAESVVVLDGQESPPYDGIGENSPIFERNNSMMCRPPWPPCVVPNGPTFTPDNRLIYKAMVGPKLVVIVNRVAGPQYDNLGYEPLASSPDGKRVAYVALVHDKRAVVVDGTESRLYDAIGQGTPVFSPDGTRVAFDARVANQWVVVVDGIEWPQRYDRTMQGTPVFSPDGQHVLSAVRHEGSSREAVVVDGQDGDHYDAVLVLQGRIIFDSARSFHYLARRGTSWVLVEETLE